MCKIVFVSQGKKIGHKLDPGTYEAQILRSRFNRAGNLELVLTDIRAVAEQKFSETCKDKEVTIEKLS